MQKNPSRKSIEIKISSVLAVSAILRESDTALLDAALREMTAGEPDFFDGEFAVVDAGFLEPGVHVDWPALIHLFKSYRLHLVAVRNAAPGLEQAIRAQGLTLESVAKPYQGINDPVLEPVVENAPPPIATHGDAMIVDAPIRAGQRIYARGSDLIVTAAVNNGAEVIADGSIHIYAPLRGRALAGANGHTDARIFTMNMEAELVSIAGIYCTFENGLPGQCAHHPTQVRLVGDRLEMLPINSGTRSL